MGTKTNSLPPGLADDRSGKCQAAEALPIPFRCSHKQLILMFVRASGLVRLGGQSWPRDLFPTCLYTTRHDTSRQTVFPTVRKWCLFKITLKSCRHIRRSCQYPRSVATSVARKLGLVAYTLRSTVSLFILSDDTQRICT